MTDRVLYDLCRQAWDEGVWSEEDRGAASDIATLNIPLLAVAFGFM